MTATDLNPPMLEIAKGKFKAEERVTFQPADAQALYTYRFNGLFVNRVVKKATRAVVEMSYDSVTIEHTSPDT